ncbi:sulfatase [Halosquirtibacter xylanolyticus]|uniref:sulfatase n=1 Tax=Halosquirtibacter xylanolyticus TaxID=3374599 RepID=UPI003749DE06|nr:sulfatase [Prolixibacteraceae bacterium]
MRQTCKISSYILFAMLTSSCIKAEKKQPPNILFIAIDDLRPDLACYGNKYVKSPNLDQLAKEGALFTNHFTNIPTCGASRHSMLTGLYPKTTKQLGNAASEHAFHKKNSSGMPETFIARIKKRGYHTIGIGKISHSTDGYIYKYKEQPSKIRELPNSWDELLFDYSKWGTGWNAFFGYANGENRQSLNKQVKPYEIADVDDTGYIDGVTANLAIKRLGQLKNEKKPFFLAVGFFKPHLPFNAPKKYWDLYNREDLPASSNPNIPKGVHKASLHQSKEFNLYHCGDEHLDLTHKASEEYSRKLHHAYYACISYVDQQVGKVINELKKQGLDKNTIIVVWGDHGWHLGDQHVWGKHTLFENALRSTLIIKDPRSKKSGVVISNIVESVDLYPTICEIAEVPKPQNINGETMVPLLYGDTTRQKNYAYGYFNKGVTLRNEQYRLIKYFRNEKPTIELYDHKTDPLEDENIAEQNSNIIKQLLPILEKGNTGLYGY